MNWLVNALWRLLAQQLSFGLIASFDTASMRNMSPSDACCVHSTLLALLSCSDGSHLVVTLVAILYLPEFINLNKWIT